MSTGSIIMYNTEQEYPCTQHAVNWNTRHVKCNHWGLKAQLSLTQLHCIGYSLVVGAQSWPRNSWRKHPFHEWYQLFEWQLRMNTATLRMSSFIQIVSKLQLVAHSTGLADEDIKLSNLLRHSGMKYASPK